MRAAAVVVLVLASVVGCAGDSPEPEAYDGADADRLAHVEPDATGMDWPGPGTFDAFVEDKGSPPSEPDNPVLAALLDATRGLDYFGDAGGHWETDQNYANLVVELWDTEEDARAAMGPYRSAIRAWNKQTGSLRFDEDVDDLGDEAFRIGDTRRMTYKWRRGNLVVEAHVGCLVCPRDLDAATRAWVDAIDEEARSG